ncbi:sugar phosphate isomerase/epimerase family protein [Mycetocola miduiensis]|uniref:Sugar phosphate isomerase/epimerase n=1 Tax=Mycetocola miduiensis TaxID=995034 RepID=A0A1I4YMG7_9MICO|nr:sugar phosphate isomerase/epimerase [Mycetocola miduiensis]SFN39235.1 Sugar phosphate isomerase/epimerase [Mycetocola miduiensis]
MPVLSDPSLQLYTVRDALAADFDGTMKRIADIGYRRVEPFNFVDTADALVRTLGETGLTAPSTHVGLLGMEDQRPAFEAAVRLGIGIVVDPHVEPAKWSMVDDVAATAEKLNAAARLAADFGLRVGYHNHHFELENRIGGRPALEYLADNLDPAVVLEVDTYWALAGGAEPVELLRRLGSRIVAIHIKDGDGSLDPKAQVAVGSGTLPIPSIVDAVEHLEIGVVELDDFDGDVFDAVRDSYAFLTGNGNAR